MNVTDDIKSRIDIVDLINAYTPLKKAGRSYKALCPFHSEKTPSFVVFPDSQTWRCFGACGEGGDIFSFMMKKEGWDFAETLRVLAEQAGVELEPVTAKQAASKETADRLRELLGEAAHFYHRHLLNSPQAYAARQYVEKRGLLPETLDRFQIGYAPEGWENTINHLTGKGYERSEIIAAGLVVEKDDGSIYDRFRDRLMIPIRDGRGQMAGFGARGMTKEAVPKYLNSPQNELFDKSGLLFGLDAARRSIRETETAVIVEGYMDVIQAHQAGFTNVVAQMGTALTEAQLKLLGRYAKSLILALDPDAAGQMATQRGREVIERVSKAAADQAAEEGRWDFDSTERDYHAKLTAEFDAHGMVRYESRMGFDIRVLILPDGSDPDDVIRDNPQAWPELLESAMPIIEYVIRSATAGKNLLDPKVKSQIARQITPMIADVADPVERSHYRQRLARLLRVEERALFPDSPAASPAPRSKPERPVSLEGELGMKGDLTATLLPTPTLSREAFCLAALIQNPRLMYRLNRQLSDYFDPDSPNFEKPLPEDVQSGPGLDIMAPYIVDSDFAHPEYRQIFLAWHDALSQDEVEPVEFLKYSLDDVTRQHVNSWIDTPLYALLRGIIPPSTTLTEDRISDEALVGLLDLRNKRAEEHLKEMQYVLTDLDDGGSSLTIQAHKDTIMSLIAAKNRIQAAQARSSSPGKQGKDNSRSRLQPKAS